VDVEKLQRDVCARHQVDFDPPSSECRLGIALQTLDRKPINGLRHRPEDGTCGWYIWAGGDIDSNDPDFFQALCVEHLITRCSIVLGYLGLPPGWRFQIDGSGYEDVWFDEKLLHT